MDNIDKLIADFAEGRLNEYTFQTALNMDMKGTELNQQKKQSKLLKSFTLDYCTARSPEDIICEQERLQDIVRILARLKRKIPYELLYILKQVVIYRRTQKSLARELGVAESTITRRIRRVAILASRLVSSQEFYECFVKTPFTEDGKIDIKIRYPADSASIQKPCKMHEYLDKCFNDHKTLCYGYCGKQCTNKTMKERMK